MDTPEKRVNALQLQVRFHQRLFWVTLAMFVLVLWLIWKVSIFPEHISVRSVEVIGPSENVVLRLYGTDQGGEIRLMTDVSSRPRVHMGVDYDAGYIQVFQGGREQPMIVLSAKGDGGQFIVKGKSATPVLN